MSASDEVTKVAHMYGAHRRWVSAGDSRGGDVRVLALLGEGVDNFFGGCCLWWFAKG